MEIKYVYSVIKLEFIGLFDPIITSESFKKREDSIKFIEDDFKKKLDELKMCENTHILDINEYNALHEKDVKYYKGDSQNDYNTYKTRWIMNVNEVN